MSSVNHNREQAYYIQPRIQPKSRKFEFRVQFSSHSFWVSGFVKYLVKEECMQISCFWRELFHLLVVVVTFVLFLSPELVLPVSKALSDLPSNQKPSHPSIVIGRRFLAHYRCAISCARGLRSRRQRSERKR